MRRAAVFAHYDKDNLIDDYVIYYVKALKEICEKLVFVSCCELSLEEKEKLNGIADYIIAERHEEYDFGSYKRGFLYLKDNGMLNEIDELVFANDSCYGPLFPLKNVFQKMEARQVDFWGITKNRFGMAFAGTDNIVVCKRPHIQSYFLVFNKAVIKSPCFCNFMANVKVEETKNTIIIKYEIGLSELLTQNGFTSDAYIKDYYRFNHVVLSLWRPLITKSKSPFLKCSVIRLVNRNLTTIAGWEEVIQKYTNYPVELIKNNQSRTKVCDFNPLKLPEWMKIFCFNSMSILPGVLKRKASAFVKNHIPWIMD